MIISGPSTSAMNHGGPQLTIQQQQQALQHQQTAEWKLHKKAVELQQNLLQIRAEQEQAEQQLQQHCLPQQRHALLLTLDTLKQQAIKQEAQLKHVCQQQHALQQVHQQQQQQQANQQLQQQQNQARRFLMAQQQQLQQQALQQQHNQKSMEAMQQQAQLQQMQQAQYSQQQQQQQQEQDKLLMRMRMDNHITGLKKTSPMHNPLAEGLLPRNLKKIFF